MLDRSEIGKRGYLNEPYRLFHLRDDRALALDYHYHEFDKLVLLLGGRVTYHIEGKCYPLQPMDVLLVSRNLIHLPVVEDGQGYERMVLWIGREFMSRFGAPEADLSDCFRLTEQRGVHLHRPRGEERERWRELFERVEAAGQDEGFAARLLADTCVLQLLICLNRAVGGAREEADTAAYRFDPKMEEVTRYIMAHLGEELSIGRLAGAFFLSRYYLMHRFKEVYGCSVHQYIRQKRLQQAAEAIRRDVPVLKAAEDAGFGDYSVFLRAFRAAYGKSPREWK
ncbi:MAG: AraC family transcriptional regulator [Oscillospiraceae bacterium]|jgi:AraC-like DNA-binding protein|nr:AraC family transcriptional regulator [Oscillospiraceae bacterium]